MQGSVTSFLGEKMKILVTGFEPFGGERINPSEEVLKLFPKKLGEHQIITLVIPTVRRKAIQRIEKALAIHQPEALILLGQAGGIGELHLEKVGINLDDFRIPDNEGNQPIDEPIYEDGENAYFSNLPLKKMAQKMNEVGVNASISYSAGTFLCNHVLYGSLYLGDKYYPQLKSTFIHLPFLLEQIKDKDTPYMSLDTMYRGLVAAIEVLGEAEIEVSGGRIF